VSNDETGGSKSPESVEIHRETESLTSVEKYIDLQENVRAAKERIWRRKN
jgi:hypothetical protein